MHSLQLYGKDKPVSNNNAYTITSIYYSGTLEMYTSHPAEGRPEHFTNQLKGWSITGDPETFRQGATAYRNARDWAKEQRDEAIQQANERANPVQVKALAPAPAGDLAGDALGAEESDGSAAVPVAQAPAASNVATRESKRWL
ncbi:uncharacterized protein BDZ99DRAFT_541115 [Mytilinidion resinicola]|uniref:Uncharacterized protein n=1 Tax=Mytilinidion resinicola TaxID=574789 RepID=A0A6A6YBC7_9PEZI|nr:uncharacterized protein BDZ99DRAFT_541115 [Mytilinidion resinicola]KAF2805314.1 hypothetical protein BDZ99DRAFT_541115 [Mytilinidion resinicola]